jgi:hypothetical protein
MMKALLALPTALLLAACNNHDTVDIPVPVIPDRPAPELFAGDSDIRVGVDISLASIQQLMQQQVQASYSGQIPDPADALTEDRVEWLVNRGGISLVEGPGGELQFTIPIDSASASLKGRFGVKKRNKGFLGWIENVFSTDFSETVNFAGSINGSLKPRVGSDWTVDPQFNVSVNLSKAETTLFGKALKISFRSKLEEAIGPALKAQVIELNAALRNEPKAKEAFVRAWNDLHQVTAVSSDPPLWLTTSPSKISLADPSISAGFLRLRLDAKLDTRLYFTKTEPKKTQPPPFPTVNDQPTGNTGYQLAVPVALKLSDFQELAASAKLPEYEDGGITVEFGNITVSGDNGRMVLGVDIKARHASIDRGIKTRLYLLGNPRLDPVTMTLSADRLDFSVATKSKLGQAAQWLLKPAILSEASKRAVFSYRDQSQSFAELANARLEELKQKLPMGVSADLKLSSIEISRLLVDDGWLSAVVIALGPAQVMVDFDPQVPMLLASTSSATQ